MNTNTRQTITVQFGPDSAVAVAVQFAGTGGNAVGDALAEREGTLDQDAGQTLLGRALATPALVSQLNALVQDNVTLGHPTDDEPTSPRCSGGRVSLW